MTRMGVRMFRVPIRLTYHREYMNHHTSVKQGVTRGPSRGSCSMAVGGRASRDGPELAVQRVSATRVNPWTGDW